MPTDGTRLVPLDDFTTSSFSNGMTTKNGSSVTIAGSGGAGDHDDNQWRRDARVALSALGSDGKSFIVTRSAVKWRRHRSVARGGGFGPGGLGRGWRRTGVDGLQGYQHSYSRSRSTGTTTTVLTGVHGNGNGGEGNKLLPTFLKNFPTVP